MTAAATLAAIVIGASLPMIALALVSRWRWDHLAQSEERRSLRLSLERAKPHSTPLTSLDWLSATIGRPPVASMREPPTTTPAAGARRCPHCHAEVKEASFFCRRCGTRLYGA